MAQGFLVKVNTSEVESLQYWTAVQTPNDRTEIVLDKSSMRTASAISPRNRLHNIALVDVAECSRRARVTVQGIWEKSQPTTAAGACSLRGHNPVKAA
jgi:hypothetical protein